jgi:steroid delta-isomerase-like uncharacterized protein
MSTETDQLEADRTEADRLEANKAVARRYFASVGKQELDDLDEFIAEDAVDETQAATGTGGREDFRRHGAWLRETVEDAKAVVTQLVAEGDQVVAFWRLEGIHRGDVFGVPGTGKPLSGVSISTLTIRDGKVVRYRVLPDRLGFIQQLSGESV